MQEVPIVGKESKETLVSEEVEEISKDHSSEETELESKEANAPVTEEEQAIQSLKDEIEKVQLEKKETYERMLRIQAEYENFKKRTEREKIAERKYKAQDLANELLPVLDNFERALQIEVNENNKSIFEGISMVYSQLKEALKSQGIDEIETVGNQFDPNQHHAIMQVEDDEREANEIVEELQKGYMLKDRVIRPAMVKVNK